MQHLVLDLQDCDTTYEFLLELQNDLVEHQLIAYD